MWRGLEVSNAVLSAMEGSRVQITPVPRKSRNGLGDSDIDNEGIGDSFRAGGVLTWRQ